MYDNVADTLRGKKHISNREIKYLWGAKQQTNPEDMNLSISWPSKRELIYFNHLQLQFSLPIFLCNTTPLSTEVSE